MIQSSWPGTLVHITLSQQTPGFLFVLKKICTGKPWPMWRDISNASMTKLKVFNERIRMDFSPRGEVAAHRARQKEHGWSRGWVEFWRCGWMKKGWGFSKTWSCCLNTWNFEVWILDSRTWSGNWQRWRWTNQDPWRQGWNPPWCGPLVGYLRDAATKISSLHGSTSKSTCHDISFALCFLLPTLDDQLNFVLYPRKWLIQLKDARKTA